MQILKKIKSVIFPTRITMTIRALLVKVENMEMKKLFALSLSAVMALSFVGCQNSTTADSDTSVNSIESTVPVTESQIKNDIYNLYDYENDEVFYVEKMDLNDKLSALCTTYEFSFLSDGYQIKAYIAIPMESIKSQQPCKCILHNRGGHYNYGSLDYEYVSLVCAYTGRAVVACEIRGDNGSEGYDQFGGDELHVLIERDFGFGSGVDGIHLLAVNTDGGDGGGDTQLVQPA